MVLKFGRYRLVFKCFLEKDVHISFHVAVMALEPSSEGILAAARFGKDLDIGGLLHPELRAKRSIACPKKGIGRFFQRKRGRHGEFTCIAQSLDLFHPRLESVVLRVDRQGELAVGKRIFVARADQRVVGQGRELAEAFMHLLRRALEDPTASKSHEAVSREGKADPGHVKSDMPYGMAGYIEDMPNFSRKGEIVAFAQGMIEWGQPCRIGVGTDHFGSLAQIRDALDMIGVMMGEKDM